MEKESDEQVEEQEVLERQDESTEAPTKSTETTQVEEDSLPPERCMIEIPGVFTVSLASSCMRADELVDLAAKSIQWYNENFENGKSKRGYVG